MSTLVGTGTLARSILRRDRLRIVVWLAGIATLVLVTASSIEGIYPTADDLRRAAALVEGNPAAIAFNGPVQGLETLGGRIAFESGTFGIVAVALMSLFTVTRLTRAEEEGGRVELLRSTVVGRHAPLAAALVVVAGMDVAVGVLVALGLIAFGLPVAGAVAFGAGFTAAGLVFAALAAVAAQVTENTRVASGMVGAAVGLAFALRAAGDIGSGALSWLSPIGWAQKARPFAGEVWWPLVVALAAAAALVALAVALAAHRDVGGGLIPPRPGPASAAPWLGRPVGLALRLQRGSLLWWTVGVLVLGGVYGSVADDIEAFVEDNDAIADVLARSGAGSLTDAFLSTSLLVLALVGSGFAVQSVLRLRGEEVGQRAEPVLAAGASRAGWIWSHVGLALAGSALVLVAGGFGVGLAYALTGGGAGEVLRLAAAAAVHVPATWVLVGVAVVLFGLAPRVVVATWAVLAFCFVVGFLGEVLDVPAWLAWVSPFEHAPRLPGAPLRALPLVATTAVAGALLAAGTAAAKRRDIPTS